jgi:PPM family protein phosphatase
LLNGRLYILAHASECRSRFCIRNALNSRLIVEICGKSDVGLVRQHNEDSYLYGNLETGDKATPSDPRALTIERGPALMVVADGVGGAASGELASSIATDCIFSELQKWWRSDSGRDASTIAKAMRKAIDVANESIWGKAQGVAEHHGMGTTATIALLVHSEVHFGQIGDSRGYVIRNGTARQLTKDQSLVQRLIDAGRMTRVQAEKSEHRNIILQALGPEQRVVSDLYQEDLKPGDFVLVCSDGLSNQVTEEEIGRYARASNKPGDLCSALMARALETGAPDNVTALAARVVSA